MGQTVNLLLRLRRFESYSSHKMTYWRDGRVVECTALEMRHTGNRIQGSNPCLSASQETYGCSSVGRALVSKTKCREFESLHPCEKASAMILLMPFFIWHTPQVKITRRNVDKHGITDSVLRPTLSNLCHWETNNGHSREKEICGSDSWQSHDD